MKNCAAPLSVFVASVSSMFGEYTVGYVVYSSAPMFCNAYDDENSSAAANIDLGETTADGEVRKCSLR